MLEHHRPGVTEFELEAELAAEFTRRRGRMAYEPIIGSYAKACVLHELRRRAPGAEGVHRANHRGHDAPRLEAGGAGADGAGTRGVGTHLRRRRRGRFAREAGLPGISIPEESLAVRLENDVLVTEQGPVDLGAHVPIEIDDIERLMAR